MKRVGGVKSEDEFVQRLDKAVREAKQNREWRHEYMTLLMRDKMNINKGKVYGMISAYRDLGMSEEEILTRIQSKFSFTKEEAKRYLEEEIGFEEIES